MLKWVEHEKSFITSGPGAEQQTGSHKSFISLKKMDKRRSVPIHLNNFDLFFFFFFSQ